MKKNILISLRLTLVMIAVCSVMYPLLIAGVGKLTPGQGKGVTISVNGQVAGYASVGQSFTGKQYFWGRPSAVDYNGAGSGGSNKGPSNPDYLAVVQSRIDTFLAYHPGVTVSQIPAELLTASGSGLDPHISPASARLQVERISAERNIPTTRILELIETQTEAPMFGPSVINVLKLNIALDQIQ